MSQIQMDLFNEVSKLPFDKVSKVLSYVRFVSQEQEEEIWIDHIEEEELNLIFESSDFVDASVVEAKIAAMPND